MIGRVGSIFGEHGVNIASGRVGAEEGPDAVMVVTTELSAAAATYSHLHRLRHPR
jgi:hypothetical protein